MLKNEQHLQLLTEQNTVLYIVSCGSIKPSNPTVECRIMENPRSDYLQQLNTTTDKTNKNYLCIDPL